MIDWIALSLFIFVIYCFSYCFRFRERSLHYNRLNGPSQIPFLGNLLQFDITQFCVAQLKWTKKFGTVFRAKVDRDLVCVNDPDLIKEIFITEIGTFQKSNLTKIVFGDLAGGLILAQNGDEWHGPRKLFQPAFHPTNLQHGFRISCDRAQALIKKIEDFEGKQFDIQALVLRFTFDVIGLIGFGAEFNSIESNESPHLNAFEYCLQHLITRVLFPYRSWKLMPFLPGEIKYAKEIKLLRDEIQKQMKRYRQNNIKDNTILSCAINVENPPDWLTDEEIVKQMMTFLFAGHDTTANILSWIFYFVTNDEKRMQKLVDEIRSTIHDFNSISENTLAKMPYLNAVIKETLRLRPSAPTLPSRCTTKEKTIHWRGPFGEQCSETLKKGQLVTISPFVVQQLEQYWKNPHDFEPERWLSLDESSMHPCLFIPFGAGVRRCIGEKLSLIEIRTVVAAIFHKFDLKLKPGQKAEIFHRVTMSIKEGVLVNASRR